MHNYIRSFAKYRDELRDIAGTEWDNLNEESTMRTTAELVNVIHLQTRKHLPLVTDVVPRENTVEYTVGFVRYIATRDLKVMEVADGKVFTSPNSWHQQNILRGEKTDDFGKVINRDSAAHSSR